MSNATLTNEIRQKILAELGIGKSTQEIAERLNLPRQTVAALKAHLTMGRYDESSALIEEEEAGLSLERDLQSFLSKDLGAVQAGLKLFREGVEVQTKAGRVDLLAIHPSNKLVVIELKAGTAADGALGQLLGYMARVEDEFADGTPVEGCIVAHDFSDRLKYAVSKLPNVKLKTYRVSFVIEDV